MVLFASDNGGERYSYLWPLSGEKFVAPGGRHPGAHDPALARPDRRPTRSATSRSSPPTGRRPCWSWAAPGPTRRTRWTARAWPATCCAARRLPERDLFWRVAGQPGAAARRLEVLPGRHGHATTCTTWPPTSREQADLAPDKAELLTELKAAWETIAAGLLPYPAA